MARLILLNGPPAAGKSTLAQRWVTDRPLALNLDLDRIWPQLGCWQHDLEATGLAARRLALAMAGAQLSAGLDVIVPQFLGRPEFIDQLAELAGDSFRHVVLLPPYEVIAERFEARADHPVAETGLAQLGGELRQLYDQLVGLASSRPDARVIELANDSVEDALRRLLRRLDG